MGGLGGTEMTKWRPAESKSEARRLIEQGGIRIHWPNGTRKAPPNGFIDPRDIPDGGLVISRAKRYFMRLLPPEPIILEDLLVRDVDTGRTDHD